MLLFSDTPIELAALDHIDLDLTIQIGEVTNSLKALGSLYDISSKVLLKGRDLSVSDFEVRGARGGRLKGNLAMRNEAELTHLDVNIAGKQIRLGLTRILRPTHQPILKRNSMVQAEPIISWRPR